MNLASEKHRLVILGGGSVGKSCLTIRYLQDKFIDDYDPTIEETYRKMVIVDDVTCMLEVLDTAGQEEYRTIRDQYLKAGEGFLIVYSIASAASFNEIEPLFKSLIHIKGTKDVPTVIVGNKSDLESERAIPKNKGKEIAKLYNSVYIEASALMGTNVSEAFETLVRRVRKWKEKVAEDNKQKEASGGNEKAGQTEKKKGGFCSLI